MKILDFFIGNMTKIFRILCSICWGVIGLGCLYATCMLWRFSLVEAGNPMGTDVFKILSVAALLVTILFLLYTVWQAKRESEMGLVRFFRKKVPNLVLTILTYGMLILLVCSFTFGQDSLRPSYAVPVRIVGGVLLLLDLCVNLKLFPDQWEESALVCRIRKYIKKKK